MSDDFLGKNQAFQATSVSKLMGEKVYRFEGKAAVSQFFNRLACIERCGVSKPDIHLSLSRCGYPVIAFSGEFRPENRCRLPAIVLSTTAAMTRTLHRFGFIDRERAATHVRTMKRRDGGLRLGI